MWMVSILLLIFRSCSLISRFAEILLSEFFFHQRQVMVSQRSLSDGKSPKVCMTLLSIMADLNDTVVWTVSTGPLISKSSSSLAKLFWIAPSARIATFIYVTFIFYCLFWQCVSTYFSFRFLWFSLCSLQLASKSFFRKVLFFFCYHHHNHHHHHVLPPARISLTLSRDFSLSFIASGRSSGLHPVSSHSCCMYVRADRPAFARPYVGVHRSTSLMSSSLLLQQCPACLVSLPWIVFVMGGRWPYRWCFVGCCLQDLFNIARIILV